MKINELIQVKEFLSEVFGRFTVIDEFNITDVTIPDGLEHNGEELWFDRYDLSDLLIDIENQSAERVSQILLVLAEALVIYDDWNCGQLSDYEAALPLEFEDAWDPDGDFYHMSSAARSIKQWLSNQES